MRVFTRDTGGAIAVMTALVMPVLIGVAAYAIDASLLLYRQERLQVAADIGAQAGADLLRRGESESAAKAVAEAMVAMNAGVVSGTSAEIKATFPEPGDRVQIDASLQVDRFFSRIFGDGGMNVRAGSIAVFEATAEPGVCIYLDDPDAKPALRLNSPSRLGLEGCSIAVASDDRNNAVKLDGRAKLTTECLDVAGGISGGDDIVTTTCEAPRTGVDVPVPDDFTRLAKAPRLETRCEKWKSDDVAKDKDKKDKDKGKDDDADVSLEPARLTPGAPSTFGLLQTCLSEMTVDRDTIGAPGIYFIEKELKIEDGATLTLGSGSVLVLLDKAEIVMDDDARLVIDAPESGALEGIAIMQGRDRELDGKKGLSHTLGILEVDGRIALPNEAIVIEGQHSMARCTRIHAGTLELAKNAVFEIVCP